MQRTPEPPEPPGGQDVRGPRWLPWLVFALLFGIYMANGRALPGADSAPHRYLPLSVLCEGDLDFDELPLGPVDEMGRMARPYWLVRGRGGHVYATFGVVPGLLATPVYALARLMDPVFSYERVLGLGKLVAALLVAAAGAVLLIPLRARVGLRAALGLVAVYALGTSMWSLGSQALWQHSAAAPFLALTLLALDRPRLRPWAGLFLGVAVLCRPTNLLLALPVAGWIALRHRRALPAFLGLAAIPALAQLALGMAQFGTPLGTGQGLIAPELASVGPDGIWGLRLDRQLGMWISPSRGLLVYSPVLALGLGGLAASWRRGGDTLLRACSLGVLGVVCLHGLRFDWFAGWSFGYRNTLDILPFVVLGMAALPRRTPRWLWAALLVPSLAVQLIGVGRYDLVSWNARWDLQRQPEAFWSVRDSQLATYLRDLRWVPFEGQDMPRRTLRICPAELVAED